MLERNVDIFLNYKILQFLLYNSLSLYSVSKYVFHQYLPNKYLLFVRSSSLSARMNETKRRLLVK